MCSHPRSVHHQRDVLEALPPMVWLGLLSTGKKFISFCRVHPCLLVVSAGKHALFLRMQATHRTHTYKHVQNNVRACRANERGVIYK